MYFAGIGPPHTVVRDGKKVRVYPGEPLPEAAGYSNLYVLLKRGEVTCDYKDGEPKEGPTEFRRRSGAIGVKNDFSKKDPPADSESTDDESVGEEPLQTPENAAADAADAPIASVDVADQLVADALAAADVADVAETPAAPASTTAKKKR